MEASVGFASPRHFDATVSTNNARSETSRPLRRGRLSIHSAAERDRCSANRRRRAAIVIVAWETGEGCCVRVGNTLLYSITSALATVGELLECSLRECGCSCPSRVVVLLLCRSHCISQVLAKGIRGPPETGSTRLKMSRCLLIGVSSTSDPLLESYRTMTGHDHKVVLVYASHQQILLPSTFRLLHQASRYDVLLKAFLDSAYRALLNEADAAAHSAADGHRKTFHPPDTFDKLVEICSVQDLRAYLLL